MPKSNTPQSQDSTSKDTKQGKNGGTRAKGLPTGTEVTPPENKQNNANSNSKWTWFKKQITLTLVIEVLVFLVAIKVACIYSDQLRQMIESNTISRESLTSVQRAFVNFAGIHINRIASPEKPTNISWDVIGQWQNSGGTQAVHALNSFRACILPEEPNEELFKGGPLGSRATFIYIAPKEVKPTGAVNKEESFLPLSGPIPPNQNRFFWGWVFYQDIFSDKPINSPPHVTEFCVILNRWGVSATDKSPTFGFVVCAHHNCVDEDCEDYNDIVQMVANKTNAATPPFTCPAQ